MSLGARIAAARIAKGLTQDELAKKLGYKSRSSINKIESGYQDIPMAKVKAFAAALDVAPEYLMSWTDVCSPEESEKPAPKTEDELDAAFIKDFGRLTPEEQKIIHAQIKGILSSRK